MQAYERFMYITSCLGLAFAIEKCTPPTLSLEWLGFSVDVPSMMVTLLQEKVVEVLSECAKWKSSTKASRKQLQTLVGKLNHLSVLDPPQGLQTGFELQLGLPHL